MTSEITQETPPVLPYTTFDHNSEVASCGFKMLLLSLGRTESQLRASNTSQEYESLFDTLKREWSEILGCLCRTRGQFHAIKIC